MNGQTEQTGMRGLQPIECNTHAYGLKQEVFLNHNIFYNHTIDPRVKQFTAISNYDAWTMDACNVWELHLAIQDRVKQQRATSKLNKPTIN